MKEMIREESGYPNLHKLSDLGELSRATSVIADIKRQLATGNPIIRISGDLSLTKTRPGHSEAYLFRDQALETSVAQFIGQRASFSELIRRYQAYDPSLRWMTWPSHFPVRILAGEGAISSGDNIFMFFPGAVGVAAQSESDIFGFEFIDVWSNVFNHGIFPCLRLLCDPETNLEVVLKLQLSLERTVYLASVFHEIGHRVGPWKCLTELSAGGRVSDFQFNALTELATDCLLSTLLPEFEELSIFVTLQRLFWFGRRGFRQNSVKGLLNEDADSWIGAYLWRKLEESGAWGKNQKGELTLRPDELRPMYRGILTEIDALVGEASELPTTTAARVTRWMSTSVPFHADRGFYLPEGMREAFTLCQNIPEVPHFNPVLPLNAVRRYLSETNAPTVQKIQRVE